MEKVEAMSKGKDFREGWTVKRGPGNTPWHYFRKGEKRSVCGSWTRDGTGILAGINGVGKGGHCKSCLKIYEKKHPDEEAFRVNTGYRAVEEIECPPVSRKVEIRFIEINILDENEDTVFKCSGTVTHKTAHKFIENVGRAFVPEEPWRRLMPVGYPVAVGKISCEQTSDCTDYPTKCSKCGNNKAKSYFKPKEEEA